MTREVAGSLDKRFGFKILQTSITVHWNSSRFEEGISGEIFMKTTNEFSQLKQHPKAKMEFPKRLTGNEIYAQHVKGTRSFFLFCSTQQKQEKFDGCILKANFSCNNAFNFPFSLWIFKTKNEEVFQLKQELRCALHDTFNWRSKEVGRR